MPLGSRAVTLTNKEAVCVKRIPVLLVAGALALTLGLSACGSDDSDSKSGSGGGDKAADAKVGVILPDTESSVRWETADRPALEKAFKDAGVDYTIQNEKDSATVEPGEAAGIGEGAGSGAAVIVELRVGK